MTLNRRQRGPLSPALEELHAELCSIEIEERASFDPELRAELERTAVALSAARIHRPVWRGTLRVVATAAALAVVAVPQARASLVRLVSLTVTGPAGIQVIEEAPVLSVAEDRPVFVPQPISTSGEEEADPAPVAWAREPITSLVPDVAYPSLRNQDEARAIVQLHYPPRLQRRAIGGSVRLILWVDESGAVLDHEIVRSSGVERLDEAALDAAPMLRFTPARRQGEPVGTWVEFDITFQPPSQYVLPEAPVVADLTGPPASQDVELDDDVLPPELRGEGSTPPVVARRGNGGIRSLNW